MPFINPGEPTKEIYEFHNGERLCRRDPAVIWRRLNAACVKPDTDGAPGETWAALNNHWALCVYSENDTVETKIAKLTDYRVLQEKLAAAAREAFDLQPLDDDGNGVTEEFVMDILMEFIGAREKKRAEYRDLAVRIATRGFGPGDYIERVELGGRPWAYEDEYGVALNDELANAVTTALPVLRAIRAAFSPQPDALLIEAASDSGGVDVGKAMSDAHQAAMLDAAEAEFKRMFGGM